MESRAMFVWRSSQQLVGNQRKKEAQERMMLATWMSFAVVRLCV
jgi:hypothetical protein